MQQTVLCSFKFHQEYFEILCKIKIIIVKYSKKYSIVSTCIVNGRFKLRPFIYIICSVDCITRVKNEKAEYFDIELIRCLAILDIETGISCFIGFV